MYAQELVVHNDSERKCCLWLAMDVHSDVRKLPTTSAARWIATEDVPYGNPGGRPAGKPGGKPLIADEKVLLRRLRICLFLAVVSATYGS